MYLYLSMQVSAEYKHDTASANCSMDLGKNQNSKTKQNYWNVFHNNIKINNIFVKKCFYFSEYECRNFMYFIDIALLYKSSDWLYDKNCPYSNTFRYIYIKYSRFFIEFFPPINQEYVLSVNSMGTYSFKQNSKWHTLHNSKPLQFTLTYLLQIPRVHSVVRKC